MTKERKKQLSKISKLRENRAILTFASAMTKKAPIIIDYDDLVPIRDQLTNLEGDGIDIILETPGGFAEIAEEIVKMIRKQFSEVAIIVPGHAKSAGTIMTMAADEIIMGPSSALGPIDAQILQGGKRFSAHAFLEGLDKIKEEVEKKNHLNRAYIPILQNISPGEIQACENSLSFAKTLVTDWLSKYKFKFWDSHSTSGNPVTAEEKVQRAKEIAEILCDHGRWLTHGRSIKIEDLIDMGLQVRDFGDDSKLNDAILRYSTLLKMSFDTTNIYKIYETPDSQIYRFATPQVSQIPQQKIEKVDINFECPNCKTNSRIQANLKKGIPIEEDAIEFPKDNKFICPACNNHIDLGSLRNQIESQTKKKIV